MTKLFTISEDLAITAFSSRAAAERAGEPGTLYFASAAELAERTAAWPKAKLIDLRNSIPGLEPIGRNGFANKGVAYKAIWKAIQAMEPEAEAEPEPQPEQQPEPAPEAAKLEKKRVKVAAALNAAEATEETAQDSNAYRIRGANPFREGTKGAEMFSLCAREQGATIDELMAFSGWTRHGVRGWFSTTSRKAVAA